MRATDPEVRLKRDLRLDEATGCLEFTGPTNSYGYGRLTTEGRHKVQAHRFAWELVHGPLPAGACVLHRCDNRKCCNPEHLFLGDVATNSVDMALKGRGRRGRKGLPYGVKKSDQSSRFQAQITFKGKKLHLGTYATAEEAHHAAVAEKARLYGGEEPSNDKG